MTFISFSMWYTLGFCSGNIVDEMSHNLCLQQYESQFRDMPPPKQLFAIRE